MKNFEQFLEATAIAPKDVKSVADKSASSDKMAQKLTQIQQRRQNERIRQGKISAPAQTRAGKALPADKGSAIVRTKRGGTGKEAVGATKKSGPGVSQTKPQEKGPGSKTYDRMRPKGGDIVKYKKPKEKKPGFRSGLASEVPKNPLRPENRYKQGKKFGKFVKKAPGKAVKGALGLAAKGIDKARRTKMTDTGIESGGSSGSYETKDTQI